MPTGCYTLNVVQSFKTYYSGLLLHDLAVSDTFKQITFSLLPMFFHFVNVF